MNKWEQKKLQCVENSKTKLGASSTPKLFDCSKDGFVQLYQCEECRIELFLKVNLKLHMDIYHKDRSENQHLTTGTLYSICDSKYNISNILRCYYCDKCDFFTYSFLILLKHKKRKCLSKRRYLKREEEKYSFKPVWDNEHVLMMKHEARYNQNKEVQNDVGEKLNKIFACKQCDYITENKSYLGYHINSKHRPDEEADWFYCSQCSWKTKNKLSLWNHNKIHKRRFITPLYFPCEQCGYKGSNVANLKKHMEEKHANSRLLCVLCGYRCSQSDDLGRHLRRLHNTKIIIKCNK